MRTQVALKEKDLDQERRVQELFKSGKKKWKPELSNW